MALPATVKNKKQGDIIRSDDWNVVTNEVDRLDVAKANLSGSAFTGPLSVQVPLGQPQLALSGGNWDVVNSQGDLRIGSASHQLRIGVAVAGGGVGDVRIRAVGTGGANRLFLGAGNVDLCTFHNDGVTTFHDSTGNTALAIAGADFILPGRTNPTWHVKNPNGTRGNGKTCRAMVNWKEGTADQLHINWGNDFAGGTFIGSSLNMPGFALSFGAATRQMIHLWNQDYGIGVQGSTQYYRTGAHYAWFRGGVHSDATFDAGSGGVMTMQLYSNGDFVLPIGRGFKPNGGSWSATSDERLKKNIKNLETALTRLMQLRGVTFEWKDPQKMGGLPGLQTGMIAQEVEKVFPEWVDNDPNGNKSIGFTGFEALMVEALRELKTDIDNIKAHVGLQAASKSAAAPAKASARSTKK